MNGHGGQATDDETRPNAAAQSRARQQQPVRRLVIWPRLRRSGGNCTRDRYRRRRFARARSGCAQVGSGTRAPGRARRTDLRAGRLRAPCDNALEYRPVVRDRNRDRHRSHDHWHRLECSRCRLAADADCPTGGASGARGCRAGPSNPTARRTVADRRSLGSGRGLKQRVTPRPAPPIRSRTDSRTDGRRQSACAARCQFCDRY